MGAGGDQHCMWVGVYAMVVEEKVRVGEREIGVCMCQGGGGRVKGEGVHMLGCKKGLDWGEHMTGCLGGKGGAMHCCAGCVFNVIIPGQLNSLI